jgi:hypothetical protein
MSKRFAEIKADNKNDFPANVGIKAQSNSSARKSARCAVLVLDKNVFEGQNK